MPEIEDSIIRLLETQSGPVTYSFIDALLPKWDFAGVSRAIENLRQSGLVSVGIEGVAYAGASNSSEDYTQEQKDGSNSKYSANIEYLSYDILIGDSEEKNPDDYDHVSEEELRELILSIEHGSSILDYSDEKTIGADPGDPSFPPQPEKTLKDELSESAYSLHAYDSTDELRLSNRIKNALGNNKLLTVKDLISNLDTFLNIRGLGAKSKDELQHFLSTSAKEIEQPLSNEQIQALRCISNNSKYIFDAFGTLSIAEEATTTAEKESPDETIQTSDTDLLSLPIDILELGDAITRCFKRNGITTIESLVSKTDDQLLKLRGIGVLKVEAARSALENLTDSGVPNIPHIIEDIYGDKVNPDAYKDYLNDYSGDVVELLDSCAMELMRDYVDLFPEAFTVCFLPLAREALDVSDGNTTAAKELVLEAIAESPIAKEAFKTSLKGQLQYAQSKERTDKTECAVRIPELSTWRSLALEVIEDTEGCYFDETSGNVKFEHPSLQDWIQALPQRNAELISNRLRGMTLDECGKKADVTRERVRQITTRILNNRPLLEEDAYCYFYTTYDIDKSNFTLLTGLDVKVGNYLDCAKRTRCVNRTGVDPDSTLVVPLQEHNCREIRRKPIL